MSLFHVDDPAELHALWRLMYDAKFQTELRDKDLWASPQVHRLAARLDEARLKAYQAEGNAEHVERHLRWRKSLKENPFVLRATRGRLREVANTDWWRQMPQPEKLEFLRGCITPFELSEPELLALVQEAEA
jgi:hypothetical protein